MSVTNDTEEMSFVSGHGFEVIREVKQIVDARDFLGTAIYPFIILAANPHLSLRDVERFLKHVALGVPGAARTYGWLQRRRWMCQLPGTDNTKLPQPNLDGNATRAIELMAQHPGLSLRETVEMLKQKGIDRRKDWVRQHRCDAQVSVCRTI